MSIVGESPKIIATGWWDGPTEGLLQFPHTEQEYYFACSATITRDEYNLRGIKLFPLPQHTFDRVIAQLFPELVHKDTIVIIGELYMSLAAQREPILADMEKGALEKVIAWYSPGTVIRAETTEHLHDDSLLTAWFASRDISEP